MNKPLPYDDFLEAIFKELKKTLSSDYNLTQVKTPKNGRTVDQFIVQKICNDYGVAYYGDQLYELHKDDPQQSLSDMAKGIYEDFLSREEETSILSRFNESVFCYESAKPTIFIELVNSENEDLLSQIPHDSFADLAMIYRAMPFVPEEDDEIISSFVITNDLLAHWGITHEELHDWALENTRKVFQTVLTPIDEIVRDTRPALPNAQPDTPSGAFELSNNHGFCGTANILYTDILDMVACGEPLLVSPLSTHKCLLVPFDDELSELLLITLHLQNEFSDPENFLSNNLYFYNPESKELVPYIPKSMVSTLQ